MGDAEIVQHLLDNGADINSRTKENEAGASGGTVLWWALEFHDKDTEVVKLLKSAGAKNISPHAQVEGEEVWYEE